MTGMIARPFARFGFSLLVGWLLAVAPTPAHAWWNGDWTIRKKVTIDTGASGVSLTEAPGTTAVLVRLFDGNFQFAAAKEDGSDLRFVAADDKTLLPFHIEKFDALLNEAFVWVNVPDMKPGAQQTIWLYYGNAGPKAVKVDDPKGTYDSDTALVYHFSENKTPPTDATGNGNTAVNATTPTTGSLIGGGIRLNGREAITTGATPSLAWTENGSMTWSAWIKPGAFATNAVVFSRRNDEVTFVVGLDNGVPFLELRDGAAPRRAAAPAAVTVNAWKHLAVTAGANNLILFVDGERQANLAAALPALSGPAVIGGTVPKVEGAPAARPGDASENGFNGEMDEMQISKIARSAGFLKFSAAAQGGGRDSRLLTFGPDEQTSSWFSGGYFGVIVGSLTTDGWVVIGLLFIMAIISWYVMASRLGYLNAMSRGNAQFLKAWQELSSDLTVLDDPNAIKNLGGRVTAENQKAMRTAAIYRIYHIGADEIRRRVQAEHQPDGPGAILSSRSIQAVRASLDGGLVRETQKLNKLMVLLTICISGGPFLGLLGTVIGVMITFAAVAAAGDVNVNAIAPGIAAALLATVAGLAVAIPALFGYNYLVTRIKDVQADMAVFIDEFVARMAEHYGGVSD